MAEIRLPKGVTWKRARDGSKRYGFREWYKDDTGKTRQRWHKLPHPFDANFYRAYDEARGALGPGPREGSVQALIDGFTASPQLAKLSRSGRDNYLKVFRALPPPFLEAQVADVTPVVIQKLMDLNADTPAKANRIKSALGVLWRWGVMRGKAKGDPTEHIKRLKEAQKGGPWEVSEVRRAVCEMRPEIAAAVALAFYTGQRKGDLLKLSPAHLRENGARFDQQKTGNSTWISLNEHASALLRELWPSDGGPFLRSSTGQPWNPQAFSDAYAKERDRIGLRQELRFHDLRHTSANVVAAERPDLVSALLGHADARSTLRYTRAARQHRDASEAAKVLPILTPDRPTVKK